MTAIVRFLRKGAFGHQAPFQAQGKDRARTRASSPVLLGALRSTLSSSPGALRKQEGLGHHLGHGRRTLVYSLMKEKGEVHCWSLRTPHARGLRARVGSQAAASAKGSGRRRACRCGKREVVAAAVMAGSLLFSVSCAGSQNKTPRQLIRAITAS